MDELVHKAFISFQLDLEERALAFSNIQMFPRSPFFFSFLLFIFHYEVHSLQNRRARTEWVPLALLSMISWCAA